VRWRTRHSTLAGWTWRVGGGRGWVSAAQNATADLPQCESSFSATKLTGCVPWLSLSTSSALSTLPQALHLLCSSCFDTRTHSLAHLLVASVLPLSRSLAHSLTCMALRGGCRGHEAPGIHVRAAAPGRRVWLPGRAAGRAGRVAASCRNGGGFRSGRRRAAGADWGHGGSWLPRTCCCTNPGQQQGLGCRLHHRAPCSTCGT
jgi:hypothetical protein